MPSTDPPRKSRSNPPGLNPPFFTDKKFAQLRQISHGFFGRRCGVSTGVYDSLNCGPGSGDDAQAVLQNRKIVADVVGAEAQNLLSLYQVHGDTCLNVTKPWAFDQRPQADAMVTDVPGIALGILTADCAPVLLYGEKEDGAPVIGAAHAGWGGAFKGVLESTILTMKTAGAENIRACIGPCIARKSYEVAQEFYNRFTAPDESNERFFVSGQRAGHFMFDLPGYCAARIFAAGVKTVGLSDQDTYAGEEDFFSYRRSVHRGESDYGRQIAVIVIKG
jgi:YfiH family protein